MEFMNTRSPDGGIGYKRSKSCYSNQC